MKKITIKEIAKYAGVSTGTVSKVINSDIFKHLLEEENITMTKAKGRGNPVRFILPIHKV